MCLLKIFNRFAPISIAGGKELLLLSRTGEASRRRRQVKTLARFLCSCGVIASFGLMLFSTSVFAQANGSKPVEQIDFAKSIINYVNVNGICSSTYISNSTYRAECASDVSELSSLVSTWESKLSAGTLTVAYDAGIEEDLAYYESALQTVLSDAGYSYTPSVIKKDGSSLAYQIAPDVITPDDSTSCTVCITTRIAAAAVCGRIPNLAASLVCLLIVGGDAYLCYNSECVAPTKPPQLCDLPLKPSNFQSRTERPHLA